MPDSKKSPVTTTADVGADAPAESDEKTVRLTSPAGTKVTVPAGLADLLPGYKKG